MTGVVRAASKVRGSENGQPEPSVLVWCLLVLFVTGWGITGATKHANEGRGCRDHSSASSIFSQAERCFVPISLLLVHVGTYATLMVVVMVMCDMSCSFFLLDVCVCACVLAPHDWVQFHPRSEAGPRQNNELVSGC